MPAHFEQACELVTEDKVVQKIPCGPDPQRHIDTIKKYVDAGYDEIFIGQIGNDQAGFLEFYNSKVLCKVGIS